MVSTIDKVNDLLINRIMVHLEVSKRGNESVQKISYTLQVIINEVEKFFVLLLLFFLLGYIKEFLVIMITIGSLRRFIGGSHRKTSEGCLIFSFTVIFTIIIVSKYSLMAMKLEEYIYCMLSIVILKLAPIVCQIKGVKYTNNKKLQFKLKAMTILLVISRIVQMISQKYANIMLASLMIQIIEAIIVSIDNKRKVGGNNEGQY